MNIWGYCEDCDRWFPCRVAPIAEWACSSCGVEPLLIENRTLQGDGADSHRGLPLSS